MRKQFENTVEREIEILSKEEVAPIPTILADTPMRVDLRPPIEECETDADQILSDDEPRDLGRRHVKTFDTEQEVSETIVDEDDVDKILVDQPRAEHLRKRSYRSRRAHIGGELLLRQVIEEASLPRGSITIVAEVPLLKRFVLTLSAKDQTETEIVGETKEEEDSNVEPFRIIAKEA